MPLDSFPYTWFQLIINDPNVIEFVFIFGFEDEDQPGATDAASLLPDDPMANQMQVNNNILGSTMSPVEAIEIAGPSQHQPPATEENASRLPSEKDENELRKKLCALIPIIDAKCGFETDRDDKNNDFYELYNIISRLLSNGHLACFANNGSGSLFIVSIHPKKKRFYRR